MSLSSCLDTTLCCQLVDLSKVMKLTAVAAVKDTYNIRGHSYVFWNQGEKLRIVKAFFLFQLKEELVQNQMCHRVQQLIRYFRHQR